MTSSLTALTFGTILLVSLLTSKSASAQTLASYLNGKTAAGHYLKLKHAGTATWTLSVYVPCKEYPCDVNENTTNTTLAAHWLSDLRVADGNTVIGLSNGMTVTFVNNGLVPPRADGTRVESYWRLEIPSTSGGKPEIVPLSFVPVIE